MTSSKTIRTIGEKAVYAREDQWAKQRSKYSKLHPSNLDGEELLSIAKIAYEQHYAPGQSWEDLNPQVANHFVGIAEAVLKVKV